MGLFNGPRRRAAKPFAVAIVSLLVVLALPAPASAAITSSSTWSPATRLGFSDFDRSPMVASSFNGAAVAVWASPTGANPGVFASTRLTTGDWTQPTKIDRDYGVTGTPQIGVADNGRAVAVWQGACAANCSADGLKGESNDMLEAGFDPAIGWYPPVKVNVWAGLVRNPFINVGRGGQVAAAWEQDNGTGWAVWFAIEYQFSSSFAGFNHVACVASGVTGMERRPTAGIVGGGDGTFAWNSPGSGGAEVHAGYWNYDALGPGGPCTGSGDASLISAPGGGASGRPIAIGYYWLVWEQFDGTNWRFYHALADGTRQIASAPVNGTDHPANITWALGPDQSVLLTWASAGTVYSTRYDEQIDQWLPMANVSGSGNATSPACALDYRFNSTLVWLKQNASGNDVWSAVYDNISQAWSAPKLVEKDNGGPAFAPVVISPSPALFVALWEQGKNRGSTVRHVHYALLGDYTTTATLQVRVDDLEAEVAMLTVQLAKTNLRLNATILVLNSTDGNVSVIRADVAELWGALGNLSNLGDARASQVSTLWASLNATKLELANLSARPDPHDAAIQALNADLNVTRDALDALTAEVDADRETVEFLEALVAVGAANDTALRANITALIAASANLTTRVSALRASADATAADLASAHAEIDRLESEQANNTTPMPTANAASEGSGTLAVGISLAALALGGAGLAIGLRAGRRREP